MSSWTAFVTKHYRKVKETNPSYKFSDALKDAAKLYNKTASTAVSGVKNTTQKAQSVVSSSVKGVGNALNVMNPLSSSSRKTAHKRNRKHSRTQRKHSRANHKMFK